LEQQNTRATLLIRLRDKTDESSWAEFVEIYTPLLYAYCQKREIKPADIADIVQNVFRSISLAMKGFEYDPSKGRFKAWLFTVLRNAISTHYRKAGRAPVTTRETMIVERIESSPEGAEVADWDHDYQLRLLNWGMDKIKAEVSEQAWTIFTETALKERAPEEVAQELGMKKNAVSVTKYRVVQKLRQKLHSIDAERWEEEMISAEKKV
jgi:RNA polymerase sigma-70 factor (ECF subfamily)